MNVPFHQPRRHSSCRRAVAPDTGRSSRSGFSLIEMLVVVSVVGLLLAFAAPQLFSLVQSTSLTSEGTFLRNKLSQAQQIALSQNTDVEVRFFKMKDPGNAETDLAYRGFQFFRYNQFGQILPVSEFFRVKPPIVINEKLSSLVDLSSHDDDYLSPSKGSAIIPVLSDQVSFDYMSFRFRPDGSTDLPGRSSGNDTWYITLVKGLSNSTTVPENYFTVQLDPFNGRVTSYRP